jgi:hypothetical protein
MFGITSGAVRNYSITEMSSSSELTIVLVIPKIVELRWRVSREKKVSIKF